MCEHSTHVCIYLYVFMLWLLLYVLYLLDESNRPMCFKDLKNWSCAIGYEVGSSSPLCPSFNFGLELDKTSQV